MWVCGTWRDDGDVIHLVGALKTRGRSLDGTRMAAHPYIPPSSCETRKKYKQMGSVGIKKLTVCFFVSEYSGHIFVVLLKLLSTCWFT
jgi:hypothetical protein